MTSQAYDNDAAARSSGDIFISVCICSYNRAESLRCMLDSLAAQEGVERAIEILVVDNNSNDHTRQVIEAFSSRIAVRYVFECRQGLSHARNRALHEFRGRYLLFTDDDVRLAPDWLAAYERALLTYPQAEFFGGRVLPDWRDAKPDWISETPLPLIDGLLCWFDLGDETRLLSKSDATPIGASFGFSRALANRVGSFDIDLGCVGDTRGRGEESEWIARAIALGAQGLYVGSAVCLHRYDRKFLTLARLFDHGVHSGRAHRIISAKEDRPKLVRIASFGVKGLWQLLRGRRDRFSQCVINMGVVYGAWLESRDRRTPQAFPRLRRE